MGAVPTLCFINHKGGVGKTTCASLMAEYVCLFKKKRVLLLDWDGQMNLTAHWVGVDGDEKKNLIPIKHPDIDENDPEDMARYNVRSSIIDIFHGKEVLPHSTYLNSESDDFESPRVDLISGSREGMKQLQENIELESDDADRGATAVKGFSSRKLIARLAEFCSHPELSEYYDLIIIDSGPSETPLFRASIQGSTHIVAPYKPEAFSIMGVTTLVNNIVSANANRIGRKERLNFLGMLPCIVDRGRGGHHERNIEEVKSQISKHFPDGMMLSNSKKISERQLKIDMKPDSVFKLRPSDPIRQECELVFGYIHDKVFANE